MEFISIDGEEKLRMIVTPYIYKTIVDCSRHYMVFGNGEVAVVEKPKTKYEND